MKYLLFLLVPLSAQAHDAPSGWTYDISCCSTTDCSPISSSLIHEGPRGYLVPSGEIIPYQDRRVRQSKDDQFHLCTYGGKPTSHTICLYVPLRGY